MVLLHGFAMHGGMFLPSVLPLATRYRFVLPDLRGFGRSLAVPYAQRDVLAGFADDLEDVVDHLGERTVHLAGLSMGALTSVAFLARGGIARVSGYTNIDQAARIHNGDGYEDGLFGPMQDARFSVLRALRAELSEALGDGGYDALPAEVRARVRDAFATFFRDAFAPPFLKRATSAIRNESVARGLFPAEAVPVYMACLASYLDQRYDFEAALASAHAARPVPVSFLVGARSEMYPARGQLALAARVRRASPRPEHVRVTTLDAGHAIPVERPFAFVRAFGRALDAAFAAQG